MDLSSSTCFNDRIAFVLGNQKSIRKSSIDDLFCLDGVEIARGREIVKKEKEKKRKKRKTNSSFCFVRDR